MVPSLWCEVVDDELYRRSRSFPSARWLTWSPAFLEMLRRHVRVAPKLRVRRMTISQRKEYAYTYTVPLLRNHAALAMDLCVIASDVLQFSPGSTLYFLTGMSCRDAGWSLHLVFAALRAAIRHVTADDWSALYAPLSFIGSVADDFPLHADLYRPNVLFNVFEQVPTDGSGKTTLLPIEELFKAIDDGLVPAHVRERITKLLTEPLAKDGYTELYNLLHGRHSWTSELGRRLTRRQRLMQLGADEGYLLHDRLWLHGRETPTGGVPRNRLRRLIYQHAAA